MSETFSYVTQVRCFVPNEDVLDFWRFRVHRIHASVSQENCWGSPPPIGLVLRLRAWWVMRRYRAGYVLVSSLGNPVRVSWYRWRRGYLVSLSFGNQGYGYTSGIAPARTTAERLDVLSEVSPERYARLRKRAMQRVRRIIQRELGLSLKPEEVLLAALGVPSVTHVDAEGRYALITGHMSRAHGLLCVRGAGACLFHPWGMPCEFHRLWEEQIARGPKGEPLPQRIAEHLDAIRAALLLKNLASWGGESMGENVAKFVAILVFGLGCCWLLRAPTSVSAPTVSSSARRKSCWQMPTLGSRSARTTSP